MPVDLVDLVFFVMQARGLGYVHFGPRALASASASAIASAIASLVFAFAFAGSFCTLDTPARVRCGRRIGPGARALIESFVFFCCL